jgi:DNA replication protein DnaC
MTLLDVRQENFVSLREMKNDHLSPGQKKQFAVLIKAAKEWVRRVQQVPGLSFVLSGPVGVGKTTIARNLLRAAEERYGVLDDKGNLEFTMSDVKAREISAPDLMPMLKDALQTTNGLDVMFRDSRIILIDDLGTEELAFVAASEKKLVRQNRYGELVNWCWRNRRSLVITSMIPLRVGDELNPDFIEVLGEKAFDRLWQMGSGYMFTMTGFPSYRRLLVP